MIKTHVLIASRQLQSVMTDKMNQLRNEPTGRLIERYNRHARTGFHVMVQAAEVACIHHLLMTRHNDSPITIESGCVVTLGPGSILGWQKDDSIDRLTFSELNDRTSWT